MFFRKRVSPCICTRNSVLILRAASLSFSFLDPQSESTSSMKMMDGLCWRARSNRFFTSLENNSNATVQRGLQFTYTDGLKNSLLALAEPLRHEVRGRHGEEGGVIGLGGHSFGQIRLACAGGAEQKNAPPRGALACITAHTDGRRSKHKLRQIKQYLT